MAGLHVIHKIALIRRLNRERATVAVDITAPDGYGLLDIVDEDGQHTRIGFTSREAALDLRTALDDYLEHCDATLLRNQLRVVNPDVGVVTYIDSLRRQVMPEPGREVGG